MEFPQVQASWVIILSVCGRMAYSDTSMISIIIQITFQAVLSTDGNNSFATFLYNEYLPRVQNIVSSGLGAIGFDAGDNSRYIRIAVDNTLEVINTFRIDGIMGIMYQYKFFFSSGQPHTM